MMKSKWISEEPLYDGNQLRSLYGYMAHDILGDSILAWVGACDVHESLMVDGEDRKAKARIAGDRMLHFILEKFHIDLYGAVALQRLLSSMAMDLVHEQTNSNFTLRRQGDDLFWGQKKFSISIATCSPVSALIHFAVNVTNQGTPVETASLKDFGLEAEPFANELLKRVCLEDEGLKEATCKVFSVR